MERRLESKQHSYVVHVSNEKFSSKQAEKQASEAKKKKGIQTKDASSRLLLSEN